MGSELVLYPLGNLKTQLLDEIIDLQLFLVSQDTLDVMADDTKQLILSYCVIGFLLFVFLGQGRLLFRRCMFLLGWIGRKERTFLLVSNLFEQFLYPIGWFFHLIYPRIPFLSTHCLRILALLYCPLLFTCCLPIELNRSHIELVILS
jgi:hypothetical protein